MKKHKLNLHDSVVVSGVIFGILVEILRVTNPTPEVIAGSIFLALVYFFSR